MLMPSDVQKPAVRSMRARLDSAAHDFDRAKALPGPRQARRPKWHQKGSRGSMAGQDWNEARSAVHLSCRELRRQPQEGCPVAEVSLASGPRGRSALRPFNGVLCSADQQPLGRLVILVS